MIIASQSGRIIINTEYVDRYTISNKPDAVLVTAGFGGSERAVTLGRYVDEDEASKAMTEIALAISGGQAILYMPESILTCEERHIKDARTRRKGGS